MHYQLPVAGARLDEKSHQYSNHLRRKKTVKRIAAMALLAFAGMAKADVAEELASTSKPYLPKQIDSMTMLVSVKAKNKAVYYIYQVNTPANNGANHKAIGDGLRGLMIEELCNGKLSGLFPSGLTAYHAGYFSEDDKLLFNYTITKNDCARAPDGITGYIKQPKGEKVTNVADDVVKAVKPYLPKKLDSVTTLLNVTAKGDELWYSYGIDTQVLKGAKALKDGMKKMMTEELCMGEMRDLFPSGLRYFRAFYYAKNGALLFGFAIAKDDCKPHSKYGEIKRRFSELIDGQ